MKSKNMLYCAVVLALVFGWAFPVSTFAAAPAAHIITVVNLNDSGSGSLRDAIDQANSDQMPSKIVFDPILSGGTIQLNGDLPGIQEDNTMINGDINRDLRPDIEISGASAQVWNLLQVYSSHNVIRGLVLNRSFGNGITISFGRYNRVEYCYVGTDFTGTQDLGNMQSGIAVGDGASDNQIGPGNIVAYNAKGGGPTGGISVLDGLKWEYWPDFIGLTPDYTGLFPQMYFPNTGGPFTSIDGIVPTYDDGQPFGDTFGARFTGKLTVSAAGDYTFGLYNVDDVLQVIIDGTFVVEAGCMTQTGCNDLTITYPLSQGEHDLLLRFLDGPGAAGFRLEISGPGSADLTYNGQTGLWGEFFQLRIPTERNRITQNSIFANSRLGIELDALEEGWGVNFMDSKDTDIGPNTAINYPILESVVVNPGRLIVKGWIDTQNPRPLIVEFFANPLPFPGADPSGYGQGYTYLGSARATANNTFVAPLPVVSPGTLITATVTDGQGNTSEFSLAVPAVWFK